MIILGLDTSSEYAVFMLGDENGQCYESSSERHDRNLSSRLYAMLDALLHRANVNFDQIDAFAVGLGPGSFTGVRIAVTTMRTLAQVTAKPLIGIPTMAIYAEAARRATLRDTQSVAIFLPSRRNEAYAQVFDFATDHASSEPAAISYADVVVTVSRLEENSVVTGPSALLETLFNPTTIGSHIMINQDTPHADAFARLAANALLQGRVQDPLSLDPMYVAPPAVSQHKTRVVGP